MDRKVLIGCLTLFATSCLANYQVELLPSFKGTVLEEPHWDALTKSLYYVDIAGTRSTIQRYSYDENRVYRANIENATLITYIIPIDCVKNHFMVGMEHRSFIVVWDGKSPKAIVTEPVFDVDCGKHRKKNVLNDFKTDPFGRIYGGTKSVESCDNPDLNKATGSFYRYDKDKSVQKLFGNVFISNGLTWVGKKFYYADSCTFDIKQFEYNPINGNIYGEHQLFSLPKESNYIIDGITNDSEGNLYAATFGGGRILKIDSRTGKLLSNIIIPTSQITSLAFGGPKLDILYVTTANKDGKQPFPAGYLFKITTLNMKGFAGVRAKIYESCKNLTIKIVNSNSFC